MVPPNVIPFRPRRRRAGDALPRDWIAVLRGHWGMSLDRLVTYVSELALKDRTMKDLKIVAPPGEPVITMTRSFAAPRALVWKAMSEPQHVVRWWGPHGHTNRVLEFDFQVGGRWGIETTTGDGQVINFFGIYRVIEAPEVLTQTFSFTGLAPNQYSVDTVVLVEIGDRTIYVATSVLPDVAARDGMIASGMETGVVEGFERLDAMLDAFKLGDT